MSAPASMTLLHCNECGQETKHELVSRAESKRTYSENRYDVDVVVTWKTLQCRGCDEVTLHRQQWCSENDPMDGPDPGTFFPPRVSRRKPAWVDRLDVPAEYVGLLNEVYAALHADSRRLATMGARALIDAIILRNVGDQRTFQEGLDALVREGLASKRNRDIIDAALGMGHAAAHRGHNPSAGDVTVVIDIVENVIHNELLAEPAIALKAATPQRSRAKKNEQQ